jgi:hypothetical protein
MRGYYTGPGRHRACGIWFALDTAHGVSYDPHQWTQQKGTIMQGYLVVRRDKATAVWMTQCQWEITLDSPGSMPVDRQISRKSQELDPGVYHLSVKSLGTGWGGMISTDVGSRIKNVPRLIEKLQNKSYGGATTGMPGIQGFQHGADMANASLHARSVRASLHAKVLTQELGRI